jgi:hypothetical protein
MSIDILAGESWRGEFPMSIPEESERKFPHTAVERGGRDSPETIHLLPMLINKGGDGVRGYGV